MSAQSLRALVQNMPEAELLELIRTLPLKALRIIERLFAEACDCSVEPSESLGEALLFNPRCCHTQDTGQYVLPFAALELLCARLPDYAEPPAPQTRSICVVKDAKVGVYAQRHRDGLGLRHPRDLRPEDVEDVHRQVKRRKHGSGMGRLVIGAPTAATAAE